VHRLKGGRRKVVVCVTAGEVVERRLGLDVLMRLIREVRMRRNALVIGGVLLPRRGRGVVLTVVELSDRGEGDGLRGVDVGVVGDGRRSVFFFVSGEGVRRVLRAAVVTVVKLRVVDLRRGREGSDETGGEGTEGRKRVVGVGGEGVDGSLTRARRRRGVVVRLMLLHLVLRRRWVE
jgi:hypothetical protein